MNKMTVDTALSALRVSRDMILQWMPNPFDLVKQIEDAMAEIVAPPLREMHNIIRDGDLIAGVTEIHDWVLDAKAGESAVYFIGELSRECEVHSQKAVIRSSRDYAQTLATQGYVALVQRKNDEVITKNNCHTYSYAIQRTDKPFRRG